MASSVRQPRVGMRAEEARGELPIGGTPRGEADNVGVLNGWTENELLRTAVAAVLAEFLGPCTATFADCSGRACSAVGGELPLKS